MPESIISIQEADLKDVAAVHRQIPEFESDYIPYKHFGSMVKAMAALSFERTLSDGKSLRFVKKLRLV